MTKRIFTALALVAILLVAWVVPVSAHGNSYSYQSTIWGTSFFYKIGEGTVTAQLIAGKTGQVGTLTVWENSGDLKVQYDVLEGWNFTETSAFVGRGRTTDQAESKIPQDKKGNYDPDKFGNSTNQDPFVLTFNESDLGKGNWLCIAAYAELIDNDESTLKAWGDLLPVGAWKLPKTVSEQIVQAPASDNLAAFGIQLSNITGKYSIGNLIYDGWCVDYNKDILDPIYDNVSVYSSLSNLTWAKNVPDYIKTVNWHEINYILNHHDPDASWISIQWAILTIVNGYDFSDPLGEQLAADAIANGTNFVPGPGQVGAVILDAGKDIEGNDVQPLIIEINAPTGCYKEYSCRYDCTPNWSPCQNNWEPAKWNQHNWTPSWTTHNSCNSNNSFNWNYNWTVTQNLNHFEQGCK